MSKFHFTNSIFLFFSAVVALVVFGSVGSAKTQDKDAMWISSSLIRDVPHTSRPNGFRLAGDRAGTLWITVEDKAQTTKQIPSNDQIAFNQIAVLESVRLLKSETSEERLAEGGTLATSYVSRKAENTITQQGSVLISWPFLVISALASLLLWVSQRRRSA